MCEGYKNFRELQSRTEDYNKRKERESYNVHHKTERGSEWMDLGEALGENEIIPYAGQRLETGMNEGSIINKLCKVK